MVEIRSTLIRPRLRVDTCSHPLTIRGICSSSDLCHHFYRRSGPCLSLSIFLSFFFSLYSFFNTFFFLFFLFFLYISCSCWQSIACPAVSCPPLLSGPTLPLAPPPFHAQRLLRVPASGLGNRRTLCLGRQRLYLVSDLGTQRSCIDVRNVCSIV